MHFLTVWQPPILAKSHCLNCVMHPCFMPRRVQICKPALCFEHLLHRHWKSDKTHFTRSWSVFEIGSNLLRLLLVSCLQAHIHFWYDKMQSNKFFSMSNDPKPEDIHRTIKKTICQSTLWTYEVTIIIIRLFHRSEYRLDGLSSSRFNSLLGDLHTTYKWMEINGCLGIKS